jgi:hypothetical protein
MSTNTSDVCKNRKEVGFDWGFSESIILLCLSVIGLFLSFGTIFKLVFSKQPKLKGLAALLVGSLAASDFFFSARGVYKSVHFVVSFKDLPCPLNQVLSYFTGGATALWHGVIFCVLFLTVRNPKSMQLSTLRRTQTFVCVSLFVWGFSLGIGLFTFYHAVSTPLECKLDAVAFYPTTILLLSLLFFGVVVFFYVLRRVGLRFIMAGDAKLVRSIKLLLKLVVMYDVAFSFFLIRQVLPMHQVASISFFRLSDTLLQSLAVINFSLWYPFVFSKSPSSGGTSSQESISVSGDSGDKKTESKLILTDYRVRGVSH